MSPEKNVAGHEKKVRFGLTTTSDGILGDYIRMSPEKNRRWSICGVGEPDL